MYLTKEVIILIEKTKVGVVDWETLKADLNALPKETLVEMVSMWIQNYWVCQNYWVSFVENEIGVDATIRLDGEVFKRAVKVQGKKLKELLNLGDDMFTLAFVLKHTAPQWTPAGFRWEFLEVSEERIRMCVRSCPMGDYRKSHNLEVFPCKELAMPLYNNLAQSVNPKIKATCVHAHPDAPKEDLMCQWEFTYEN